MTNKNYRNSLYKWNAGLWDRLEGWLGGRTRNDVWDIYVWNSCGFCKEFTPTPGCGRCPLYLHNHCSSIWFRVPKDSILRVIRTAWENDDREAFEIARAEFYNILKSYEDRFGKD